MSLPHATAYAPYAATSTEDIPWLFLDARAYRRLGLVTIRRAGGTTTRANHVIVSNYGIFIIELNPDAQRLATEKKPGAANGTGLFSSRK